MLNLCEADNDPLDKGCKLNVQNTFKSRPGSILYVLCTFNLSSVFRGKEFKMTLSMKSLFLYNNFEWIRQSFQ